MRRCPSSGALVRIPPDEELRCPHCHEVVDDVPEERGANYQIIAPHQFTIPA